VAISGTIPAISHVAVTVTDLSVSEAWYTRVFGVERVLHEDTGPFRHIDYQLGGTLFGLHRFPDLSSKDPFDERRLGRDHISFGCASRAGPAAGLRGKIAGPGRDGFAATRWHPGT
jgi:catechol 2,3-dioxygenase-like lactoylglutathione lyase family enzyme